MSNIERTDTNVGNIKKDIERCEQLIKPEHANWIGISNQKAIAHLIDRNRELEEENKRLKAKIDVTNWQEKTVYECLKEKYIPIQKVKDLIENEAINISGFECIAVEDLEELLEESK